MNGFSVTYQTIYPGNEDCEACGYIVENVSLRQAIDALQGARVEASCYPFDPRHNAWFTTIDPDRDYRTGVEEWRSLHMPRNLTPSTRARIARVLGVRMS